MEGLFQQLGALLSFIIAGSSPAVTALLMLLTVFVGFMYWKKDKENTQERTELIIKFQKQITEDRADLLVIIDKYQHGQISVIQAMNEIKVLIASLGAKL